MPKVTLQFRTIHLKMKSNNTQNIIKAPFIYTVPSSQIQMSNIWHSPSVYCRHYATPGHIWPHLGPRTGHLAPKQGPTSIDMWRHWRCDIAFFNSSLLLFSVLNLERDYSADDFFFKVRVLWPVTSQFLRPKAD